MSVSAGLVGAPTLCEGLEGPCGERTFAIAQAAALPIARVSELAVRAAIAFAYTHLGVLVEPSAAVVIAAVRAGLVPPGDRVLVLSGGNVEPDLLDEILLSRPA